MGGRGRLGNREGQPSLDARDGHGKLLTWGDDVDLIEGSDSLPEDVMLMAAHRRCRHLVVGVDRW
jgi:hypothetical protein